MGDRSRIWTIVSILREYEFLTPVKFLNTLLKKDDELAEDPEQTVAAPTSFSLDAYLEKLKRATSLGLGFKGFILFVGDDGGILVLMQGGRVSKRLYAPSPDPEHIEAFVNLLEEHPSLPIMFLVDMMDQSYVRHTLPPVSPLSINKLVKRRLQRDFAPEDITGALQLGRDKVGRKEWNYLLISIANSALIQQWFDMVLDLPNRFYGVYLVPVESQGFILDLAAQITRREDEEAQWKLLVCHDKVSGFRQIVLKDNQLVFTRLTQAPAEAEPGVSAMNIEQEVLNTIEYLKRLSYNDQAGLELYVIASQDINNEIDPGNLKLRFVKCFTPYEVADFMGLDQAALSNDRFADVVMAARFGRSSRRLLRLMPAYGQKLDILYKARAVMRYGAMLLMLFFAYYASNNFMGADDVAEEIEMATSEQRTVRKQLVDAEDTLGSLGADQGDVLRVATLYRGSVKDKLLPLDFVKQLARVTNDKRLIRLFEWDVEEVPVETSGRSRRRGEPRQMIDRITAKIEVKIIGHGGDKKRFVNQAHGFLTDLKKTFEGYEVENEPLPGMTSEAERLVLNFDDQGVEEERLEDSESIITVTIIGPTPKQEGSEG